jgi:hypothetical protein
MARAGLAEPSLRLLRAAVAYGGTVARFRAKIAVVPGSGCEYWMRRSPAGATAGPSS